VASGGCTAIYREATVLCPYCVHEHKWEEDEKHLADCEGFWVLCERGCGGNANCKHPHRHYCEECPKALVCPLCRQGPFTREQFQNHNCLDYLAAQRCAAEEAKKEVARLVEREAALLEANAKLENQNDRLLKLHLHPQPQEKIGGKAAQLGGAAGAGRSHVGAKRKRPCSPCPSLEPASKKAARDPL
jgi:hypothetical protein